ncbi:MAG: hypothetical protein OEY20_03015 [Gemmatimonadota bacterium]|nr:hypothetical protein [Gemmatimonadota bacterium]MDH4350163.1 hypothetical protein [Gemmatimonadota bacterium]MDH5196207.1 hypothetical protein [Gemmatimonadota bacterium]
MPRRLTRWIVAAGIAAALLIPTVIGAVYVSPTALFLDDDNRNGQLTVGNRGTEAEEVSIELRFGFVDADSSGTPFIRFIDDPGPEFPSATEWLGVYPQRVRLAPGEKRTVRVFARPPADLPNGEYWSRLIVSGRRAAIDVATGDSLVRAGVNVEVRLVTSVTFRKGAVSTGLTLHDIAATPYADSLVVRTGMERRGTAAYLGTVYFEVLDQGGAIVREWATPVSVHVSVTRRFVFPLEPLPPGTYTLRLRAETTRPDIAEARVLPARTVTYAVPLTVE